MNEKYKILRAREVMNLIGFRARSSFDYFYKDPENHFPAPVNITKSRYGWVSSEVDAWLAERLEARGRINQGNNA
ncbi:AlpA family phage regulatory protein [Klebsiella quasipneumoniae]|uniref:helix-turn-helix transcriptional regulator n=1 Tax=Klebsiella TaxID=570 RepID=UPI00237952A1|nr:MULTISPECIES: AlpA family phage regulatory protein [Klebsiella]MDD9215696.1 AlpA family phage regulatory protein [Klebsiella quasipneumoniae]MDQ2563501.1 AlpA family phage regulatory protein [Klebsiella michiganensis]HDT6542761.1 AlpA family phage regulatory protein [Klebsiella variicola]